MASKLHQLKKKKTRNFQEKDEARHSAKREHSGQRCRGMCGGERLARPARLPLVRHGKTVEEFFQCDALTGGSTLARSPCTWKDRPDEDETRKKVMLIESELVIIHTRAFGEPVRGPRHSPPLWHRIHTTNRRPSKCPPLDHGTIAKAID